jgi:hypothetical protein
MAHLCVTMTSRYNTRSLSAQAAPHVAGAAVGIWNKYPSLTAMQVRDALLRSGTVRPTRADRSIGGTILDIDNADRIAAGFANVQPPLPPPPGGCTRTHTIRSGDICSNLIGAAGGYGLPEGQAGLDRLAQLNPGLNCNALWVGQAVCVAGSGR